MTTMHDNIQYFFTALYKLNRLNIANSDIAKAIGVTPTHLSRLKKSSNISDKIITKLKSYVLSLDIVIDVSDVNNLQVITDNDNLKMELNRAYETIDNLNLLISKLKLSNNN